MIIIWSDATPGLLELRLWDLQSELEIAGPDPQRPAASGHASRWVRNPPRACEALRGTGLDLRAQCAPSVVVLHP